MPKIITSYEAPALLDAHPTLSRFALYGRLAGPPEPRGPLGLSTCLAEGVMRWAQAEYGWSAPIGRTFERDTGFGIKAEARAYATEDQSGPLLVIFVHLASYVWRSNWARTRVAPPSFRIQANWLAWIAEHERVAFLVLTDKDVRLEHVDRDPELIDQLVAATGAMAHALDTETPPPIDAGPVVEVRATGVTENSPATDLDDLVRRMRASRVAKAETANAAVFAEHAAESAAAALKAALPPGSFHDVDGIRTYFNAKTGRLTEEKLDAACYF